jgi:hypothetical protein
MPRRIDLGRAVLFAGSALLLVSLFLDWYDPGISGWEAFETLDLVLALLAVAGMAGALRPDLLPPWAAAAVPGAALLIVFVQLVNDPPAVAGADLASGAWIALAGTLLMAAGAALSLAAISVTVQVAERDLRRRVAAVDRRQAEEDAVAEDLAADDDLDHEPAPGGATRMPSLLGDLGAGEDRPGDDTPPRRTGRFTPSAGDDAPAGGELERTQPMSALPDADEERPERP